MQKQTKSNQWADTWANATLEKQLEMIMTYYRSALYKAAYQTFTENNEGIFAGAYMNFDWTQDAVQDAMENACKHLIKHKKNNVRYPKAWLRTLTRNSATAIMKRFYTADSVLIKESQKEGEEKPIPWIVSKPSYVDLDDEIEYVSYFIDEMSSREENAQKLHEAMNAVLSEEEVMLLKAKYVIELSYEDLAVQTGKNIGTLKAIISRAKTKVRRELEKTTI